jgi:hypothetical protein
MTMGSMETFRYIGVDLEVVMVFAVASVNFVARSKESVCVSANS